MANTKASDLRKEVIDTKSGRRLGEVIDVELDDLTGKVVAIVVPGEAKLFGLIGGGPDVVIPWTKIKRVELNGHTGYNVANSHNGIWLG